MDKENWFTKFTDSLIDAISNNLLKRFLYAVLFGAILGGKKLIHQLDIAGASGGGWKFLYAFWVAEKAGVTIALGSAWNIIVQFTNTNLNDVLKMAGSIGFTAIMLVALFGFWFQPVSFLMNVFDFRKGQQFGKITRGAVTVLVILILSAIAFYAGSGEVITSNWEKINNDTIDLIENITENITNEVIPTINLLGGNQSG